MTIATLSKNKTLEIKAIAIVVIALHNFFHWTEPYRCGENEFYFNPSRVRCFLDTLVSSPADCINTVISFLGHYGVVVFVLLSGYGLTLSMMKNKVGFREFICQRAVKLWLLLLVGVVVFFFSKLMLDGELFSSYDMKNIGLRALFIHTLIPGCGTKMVGPWWFFGLIFQLYLLFPPLYRLLENNKVKMLTIIAMVCVVFSYLCVYGLMPDIEVYVFMNAPGHLPVFVLGMWLARNPGREIPNVTMIVALIVFVLGNFYKALFPLTFLSVAVMTVFFIFPFGKKKEHIEKQSRLLVFMGKISMIVFVSNGVLRDPFVTMAGKLGTASGRYCSALLFLTTTIIISILGYFLYQKCFETLKRKTNIFNKQ